MARSRLPATAFALCLVLVVSTQAAAETHQRDSEPPGSSVADAVRFRAEYGLASGVEFVRETLRDTARYSAEPYGVPLSGAEIGELLRRGEVQNAMDSALEIARSRPDFAGAYLDQLNRGRPVFLFTSDAKDFVPALASRLPSGADPQVAVVERTEQVLVDLKARVEGDLTELWELGVRVAHVGVDVPDNTVEVGLLDLGADSVAAVKQRYGEHVEVVAGTIGQADVCDASNNCRPIKGGISINPTGIAPEQCTSGFVVKRTDTSTLAILTAGHCIEYWGGYDVAWQHNSQGFGRALYETWKPGGTGAADVGLITIQSPDVALMTNKNHMRRTNGSLASVTNVASPVAGGSVCRVGLRSGHDCGTIIVPNEGNWSETPDGRKMWVSNTTRVSFDSSGGDSGGPVFFYPGGGTCCTPVTALGTHVHSKPDGTTGAYGWFSPYFTGRNDYAAMFPAGHTYNICLTASC